MDAVAGGDQLFERRDGEGRRAAEDERKGHFVIGKFGNFVSEKPKSKPFNR
jgi:hypothetical protein